MTGLVERFGMKPKIITGIILAKVLLVTLAIDVTAEDESPIAPVISLDTEPRLLPATGYLYLNPSISGTSPFTFQWFRNGLPLADQNGSRLNQNFSEIGPGLFSLQVEGPGGTTLSDPISIGLLKPQVPVFTLHPAKTRFLNSSLFPSLQANATSSLPIQYQWYRNDEPMEGYTRSNISFRNQPELLPGTFHVVATNDIGSTESRRVEASWATPQKPIITLHPTSVTWTAGSLITRLQVSATGDPNPTYRWFKNGEPIREPSSTPELAFFDLSTDHNGEYFVEVSNSVGTVQSEVATVTVLPVEAPVVTGHPSHLNLIPGSPLFLGVTTLNSRGNQYQWYHNGEPSGPSSSIGSKQIDPDPANAGTYYVVVTNGGLSSRSRDATVTYHPLEDHPVILSTPGDISGLPSSWYTLSIMASSNTATVEWRHNGELLEFPTRLSMSVQIGPETIGTYTATVTTSEGTRTSRGIGVELIDDLQPPTILQHPSSVVAELDADVSLSVEAGSYSRLSYQWFHNETPIADATERTYTINFITATDLGEYQVVATNAHGSTASTKITVSRTPARAPEIIYHPSSALYRSGDTSPNLYAEASGSGPLNYTWYRNGEVYFQEVQAYLSILRFNPGETYSGDYYAVVSNDAGSATSDVASIRAIEPPNTPNITTHPIDQTVYVGDLAEFIAGGESTTPISYRWLHNNQPIAGADHATFNITETQASDAGVYVALVENPTASVPTSAARLQVVTPVLPQVSQQPTDVSATLGQTVTLRVEANGDPAPTYQWIKNGRPLPSANQASLILSDLSLADAADYHAIAINRFGRTVSRRARVEITAAQGYALGTHRIAGHGLDANRQLAIINTLIVSESPTRVSWETLLPSGWQLVSTSAATATASPATETEDLATWTWDNPAEGPHEFSYTLQSPVDSTTAELTAMLTATYPDASGMTLAQPDPLQLGPAPIHHTVDTDQDGRIALGELLRLIELYNTRHGSSRTGIYRLEESSVDGFSPDPALPLTAGRLPAKRHLADTDRNGAISLSELLRVIELYNHRNGTTRTGTYKSSANTVDGFTPGGGDE
jgi:hypothetical protein